MPVRVMWHPSSFDHEVGPGHPESPERLRAVLDELRLPAYGSLVAWHEAEAAEMSALTRVHPAAYLERLRAIAAGGGGRLDQDTVMSAGSFDAARYGAGAAVELARRSLAGEPSFAAIRPPGHHATATVSMGFCLINHVVVAAHEALAHEDVSRVLIVDWDVHHGNGTQDLVERNERIRYVSLHQWPLYPGTGRAEERGVGNIFNVPRPPGLSRDRYVSDLNDAVTAATQQWTPNLILISAGFDALAGDPLGGFTLEPEDYASWVTQWRAIGAPIGAVLEGGYNPRRVALAAGAMVRALA